MHPPDPPAWVRPRIFLALDVDRLDEVTRLARACGPFVDGFKVGLQLFTSQGPVVVEALQASGLPVFLDLKLHDIPNTVAAASRHATRLGVSFLTVHALGGSRMVAAAVEACRDEAHRLGRDASPAVLGVTLLTSHAPDELGSLGLPPDPAVVSSNLAQLAQRAGAAGVVCSAHEAPRIKGRWPDGIAVVPGIRTSPDLHQDQRRVASPREAARAGADWIVAGRMITQARDPAAAARRLAEDLGSRVAPP